MNNSPALAWFARHEFTLAWRDLYALMSANRPGRGRKILVGLALLAAALHLLAWAALRPYVAGGIEPDKHVLIIVTGFLLLPVSLTASQAMESITRAFYTRSDLELIVH